MMFNKVFFNNACCKKKIRYWLYDPFFGFWDYLIHYSLRYVPLSTNAKIGQRLALLGAKYRFKKADQRIKHNLAVLCPELTTEEREILRLKNWQHLGQAMCEYSQLDKIYQQNRVQLLNEHYLQQAVASQKALIFVSSHTGNWELCGNYVAKYGLKMLSVYQPIPNRFVWKIVTLARQRLGTKITLLEANSKTMRLICKHLKAKNAIWMAIDEFKQGQVQSPGFGQANVKETATNLAYAVRLAQQHDAYIIPMWTKREAGSNFSIEFSQPFQVSKDGNKTTILGLKKMLENWVISNIEQWYMLHRLRL